MTDSVFPLLVALRDTLGAVPGIQTSRIGLEANMTPADYPMVRIETSRLTESGVLGRRGADVLVYFGMPLHEFTDGLEAMLEKLLALEASLVEAATSGPAFCRYIETIADEGRVDGYRLMALRLRVEA